MWCSAGDEPINSQHLQLIKWTNKEGSTSCLRLYDEMAPNWKDVADLLKLNTKIIGVNHRHDIMSAGPNTTTYPCTWKGLCELLDDVGFGKASKDLQEACSSQYCET